FPAILPASLTTVEQNEGRGEAGRDAPGALLGSPGRAALALPGHLALPRQPAAAGLLAGLAAWAVVGAGPYLALRHLPVAARRAGPDGRPTLGRPLVQRRRRRVGRVGVRSADGPRRLE